MPLPKNARPDDIANMAERLRALRMTTGLSQEKFAEFVGLGYSQWANFEAGHRRIGLEAALTITQKLGAPLDWIYLGQEGFLPPILAHKLFEARREIAKQKPGKVAARLARMSA